MFSISLGRAGEWFWGESFYGYAKNCLCCGTIIEAFHCNGEVAPDMDSDDRVRSCGRSGPAARKRTSEMPSGPGLWDDLLLFFAVMMLAKSNEMEVNLT